MQVFPGFGLGCCCWLFTSWFLRGSLLLLEKKRLLSLAFLLLFSLDLSLAFFLSPYLGQYFRWERHQRLWPCVHGKWGLLEILLKLLVGKQVSAYGVQSAFEVLGELGETGVWICRWVSVWRRFVLVERRRLWSLELKLSYKPEFHVTILLSTGIAIHPLYLQRFKLHLYAFFAQKLDFALLCDALAFLLLVVTLHGGVGGAELEQLFVLKF